LGSRSRRPAGLDPARWCTGTRRDGPCQRYAKAGGSLCLIHDPDERARRAEERRLVTALNRQREARRRVLRGVENVGAFVALLEAVVSRGIATWERLAEVAADEGFKAPEPPTHWSLVALREDFAMALQERRNLQAEKSRTTPSRIKWDGQETLRAAQAGMFRRARRAISMGWSDAASVRGAG
jgi:hypothetical protein